MKSKKKHSKKRIIAYIIIAIVIIFVVSTILGSLIPYVNVTNIQLIANLTSRKNVTELEGFTQIANSIENYTLSVSNPNYYNMTLENFEVKTANFSLVGVRPNLPVVIKPQTTENFTLLIKLPNYTYNGTLSIIENYKINHIYYKYNSFEQLNLTNNELLIIKAMTNTPSNVSVLTNSEYNNFTLNRPYSAAYHKNINSNSVLTIDNLNAGSYYILMFSNSSNSTFNFESFMPNEFKLINGTYAMNFNLNNISKINFTCASTDPSQIYLSNNNRSALLINITKENLSSIWLINQYLNKGNYTISVKSNGTTLVAFNITPRLVNPFHDIFQNKSNGAVPTGIASYGLYDTLNKSTRTYQIRTNEIIGIANVSSIKAYNATPPSNVSKYGASLQLNVVMNGYNSNGKEMTYWLQDVVRFNTSDKNFYILDNIWNYSLPQANMTEVYGNGKLSTYTFNSTYKQKLYVFSFPKYYMNYSLPLSIKLITIAKGNRISFGYQILKNDYCNFNQNSFTCRDMYLNATPQSVIFYDNVTIPDLNNYSILVTPYYETPGTINSNGNYYDAELIFGGEGNGENTTFSSMNATLQLLYKRNGTLTMFPTYYTFGRDTEEGVYNLYTAVKNGTGYVNIGNLNPLDDIKSDYNLTYLQHNYTLR
ncbi:MAG: thermopsin [Candidatus Micrarchaeales archaeon]|jgi:thermopsin|uniref:Peptidase A5, thermopsin n=1 Tax=Candidatus Micrarchaeum acidiphilum ARMAN-2 TaxID=425595 RepID=C7DHR3_MICA2|nr:MAG: Peptidase A5, thermopsin [Candidatus Micrarchaeum acidiphilum ARMAN-2]MCW6160734.1 thermopsin [Candidatus Micrarchaeales archaeon]